MSEKHKFSKSHPQNPPRDLGEAGPWKIKYVQVMDEHGKIVDKKWMPKLSKAEIREMYVCMITTKVLSAKMVSLQRQGRMGTLATADGQEAIQVGSASAMEKEDWMFPSYRELGCYVTRGSALEKPMLYLGGDERGGKSPEESNDFPIAVPVASQISHAAGAAMAIKKKGHKNAAITYFGDGATSRLDFHDGMNFAGVFRAPCVFICSNNQYAISTPRDWQTAAETIAQKAIAYGFEGIQVDGNDIFGSYAVTKYALDKAKAGKGPTLIEAITYRTFDHTTSDDAKKYRGVEEVEKWRKRDPIERLRKYMEKNGIADKKYFKEAEEDAAERVAKAVKVYEATPPQELDAMFRFLYAEMPEKLKEQLAHLKDIEERKKKEGA